MILMQFALYMGLGSTTYVNAEGADSMEDMFVEDTNALVNNLAISGSANDNWGTLVNIVNSVYNFAVPVSVFLAFILFIWAGFLMIQSRGNPEKLKEAKEVAVNAVIGFIVIALSIAILSLMKNALSIPD